MDRPQETSHDVILTKKKQRIDKRNHAAEGPFWPIRFWPIFGYCFGPGHFWPIQFGIWCARKGGGPKGGGPGRWEAQNFALFFPFPPHNSFFSSLSGGLLLEFWWCLKRRSPEINVHVGALCLSCEAIRDVEVSYEDVCPNQQHTTTLTFTPNTNNNPHQHQPQHNEGTPQSIQDRVPSAVPASVFETPTTVPASSGTVRRLALVQSQPVEPIGEGRPEPGLDA